MHQFPEPNVNDLFIGDDLATPLSPLANLSQHGDDLSIKLELPMRFPV